MLWIREWSKSWLTPLRDHDHTVLGYMEIVLHIVLHRIRRHNHHIRLLRNTGETCTDDETVLQRKQLWKEQRHYIVYRDDVGATLRKQCNAYMIETMEYIDIMVYYATWQ